MGATPSACSAGFFTQLLAGNAILCSDTFKAAEVSDAQDQIQTVVDNANTFYGEGSATAQIAQATATQQEAQSAADVSATTDAIASSTVDQFFTTCASGDSGLAIPGLPCISFFWIGISLAALVALYVLALISSVIPRPR